jgi:hypothetical protein
MSLGYIAVGIWNNQTNKQGMCHIVAFPFTIKKKYLKAKEELVKLKYFIMQKLINLQKFPQKKKKNQKPSRYYYNSIIN